MSFSVEFGTKPITHFLINITETIYGPEVQKRFPVNSVEYVDSLQDVVSSDGTVIGYRVEVLVTDLKEKEVYRIEVAAESSIGVGLFSPLYNVKLGKLKLIMVTYACIVFTLILSIMYIWSVLHMQVGDGKLQYM